MCSPVVIKIAFITTISNSSYYTHTSPPKTPEFFLKNHVKVKNFPWRSQDAVVVKTEIVDSYSVSSHEFILFKKKNAAVLLYMKL